MQKVPAGFGNSNTGLYVWDVPVKNANFVITTSDRCKII